MADEFKNLIPHTVPTTDRVPVPWNDSVEKRRERRLVKFWSLVDKFSHAPCWTWVGPASGGYPRFCIGGQSDFCNRIAYEILAGPIFPGKRLVRTCRNVLCVNPDHMTQAWSAKSVRIKKGPLASEQVRLIREASRKERIRLLEEKAINRLSRELKSRDSMEVKP